MSAKADTGSASASISQNNIALQVENFSKVYPGTRALDDVSLTLRAGEIHALCGGNGCGKSTLIKILCGVVPGDDGRVRFGDRTVEISDLNPTVSHQMGVRVVHQDLGVFPDLSVTENIMLGSAFPTTPAGNVRWRQVRRMAEQLIARFEIPARPETTLRELPVAVRTQVAIARALRDVEAGEGLIILDEPTASLPVREVEILHAAIRRLAADGHAILFVSHRLGEVLELTHRVTVMRDGKVMAEHETATLTEEELISAILGDRVAEVHRDVEAAPTGEPLLSVSNLSAGPVEGVDLELRAGEVVGIAGLLGSGRSELLRAIYGDLARRSGRVELAGKPAEFARSEQAIRRGVVMIPEDRVAGASFPDLSLNENLDVSMLRRHWRGLGFRRQLMRKQAAELRARFRIKSASGSVAMSSLSGGNQQKAIFARWLRRDPVLLLLDEPTQGVDVGARADIYTAVRQVTDGGGAAVVVTSDFDEMAQVVDRAVVLQNGRITAHVPAGEVTAWRLNELIVKKEETDG